jgi:hypothetical protein
MKSVHLPYHEIMVLRPFNFPGQDIYLTPAFVLARFFLLTSDTNRGEKTANILESNLTSLEKKIDDLLASFEEQERSLVDGAVKGEEGMGGGSEKEGVEAKSEGEGKVREEGGEKSNVDGGKE